MVRAHLHHGAVLPAEIRMEMEALRADSEHVMKQSRQSIDRADVLIREAEAQLAAR